MRNRIYWLLLGIVVLLFLVTRLFGITSVPSSVYWDEASIGYNAYSIIQTGHDEWGKAFPLHFRAFGEFKLPVYIYSVAISEVLFGFNTFALRFPAIVFSLITLFATYLLGVKLTGKEEVGILSVFVLSVMPWFFIFSRTGYEASAGLAFFCLGVLALLYAREKKYLIFVSIVSFIVSIYSYNSYLIIAPVTFVILSFFQFHRQSSKLLLKFFLPALILLLISLIPTFKVMLFDAGFGRAQSFSLIPHIQQVYDLQHNPHLQIVYDRSTQGDWGANALGVLKNYLSHLSPGFLFISGDGNPRDGEPGFGELYWIDIIFIISALIYLFRQKRLSLMLPLFIVLLSFVPPSLFKESPHALRSFSATPFMALLIGMGIFYLSRYFKKYFFIIPAIYLIFFGIFFVHFIGNYNYQTAGDWQYGYRQIFTQYANQFSQFQKIYISDNDAQPYIFGLYYLKYDPVKFRREVKYNDVSDWGFSTVRSFNNFLFVKDKEIANIKEGHVLIFASPQGRQIGRTLSDTIKLPDGEIAFYVYSQ